MRPSPFFQIENKMDLIVEYEMAEEIPLIKWNDSLYQFDTSSGPKITFGYY